jgi:hypothetical protein
MSLVRDAYRAEILGGLADAGEDVLHVFLEADPDVLRERLSARTPGLGDPESALEWALSRMDPPPSHASRMGQSCCARTASLRPNWPMRC